MLSTSKESKNKYPSQVATIKNTKPTQLFNKQLFCARTRTSTCTHNLTSRKNFKLYVYIICFVRTRVHGDQQRVASFLSLTFAHALRQCVYTLQLIISDFKDYLPICFCVCTIQFHTRPNSFDLSLMFALYWFFIWIFNNNLNKTMVVDH